MQTVATGCPIVKDGRMLLKLATRGISKGNWNFPGGKQDNGESLEQCIKREVLEETGLKLRRVEHCAKIKFHDNGKKEIDYVVHLYRASGITGTPHGGKEGRLKWFDLESIPYDRMWDDDRHWMPIFLSGRKFEAEFSFTKDRKVDWYHVKIRR